MAVDDEFVGGTVVEIADEIDVVEFEIGGSEFYGEYFELLSSDYALTGKDTEGFLQVWHELEVGGSVRLVEQLYGLVHDLVHTHCLENHVATRR